MYFDEFKHQLPDIDEAETQDWLDSLDQVVDQEGENRARFLMFKLLKRARQRHVGLPSLTQHPVHQHDQPRAGAVLPGRRGARAADPAADPLERRRDGPARQQPVPGASAATSRRTPPRPACTRWASTTSSRARTTRAAATRCSSRATRRRGSTPARSSRAACPRTSSTTSGARPAATGLSSYPHPRLMPDFWEFPTVSMGLGPLASVYQARFNRYLQNRGIKDTSQQRVWAFLGDGEMDEPESISGISLAARDGLDNLTFVINCNLQRLDGPVRGNGKVIQELEGLFRGAGWNVIKVVWGREWDELLARDVDGVLVEKMNDDARRRVPEVLGVERRLRPRALLRPRPAAAPDRRAPVRRRPPQAPPRRPRLPQGLRRVQGGHRVRRRPDGDPGQDRQGLDAWPGR